MVRGCKNCDRLGRDCPKKLILLPLDELIDWCQYIMTKYKITHEHLASMSNTPKGTIDRIIAKQSADCRYSTIHAIVCALLEYLGIPTICLDEVAAEVAEKADDIRQQNAELQRALADSEKERQTLQARIEDLVENRDLMKRQIIKKDTQIDALDSTVRDQRRVIKTLAVLLGISVVTIIMALLVDKLNPNMGFFWRVG